MNTTDLRDPAAILCGCGARVDMCVTSMSEDGQLCCHCCDHVHSMQTLAHYGLLDT